MWASIPCLITHRDNQNPSRPASTATAMRLIVRTLRVASSRQQAVPAQQPRLVRSDLLQDLVLESGNCTAFSYLD